MDERVPIVIRVRDDIVNEVIWIPKKFEQFVNIVLKVRDKVGVSR